MLFKFGRDSLPNVSVMVQLSRAKEGFDKFGKILVGGWSSGSGGSWSSGSGGSGGSSVGRGGRSLRSSCLRASG